MQRSCHLEDPLLGANKQNDAWRLREERDYEVSYKRYKFRPNFGVIRRS